ncbi:hypothetical protein F3Y22_tig00111841pilonHSYRG00190 [Hibiscus syriacus]|uniref:Uncharacterized protein n=1 Tax=Hibiscus syriacus TaxID=106335 RepID=A0A6A2YBX5_HIBSY|nr:hypothetical protein F3Y22_tig00111841pilonHSYRG00190 [Hibiscus syriacus]
MPQISRGAWYYCLNPWVSWFKVASLPALVSLLLTPLILYKLCPPEIKDTPDAPEMAVKKLEKMGPVTRNEWIMVGTMLLAVTLWVCGWHGSCCLHGSM